MSGVIEDVESHVTADYAERWADRARLDLEASADRGLAGMTKIRTAISERHDVALGYASLGAYLSDKYADALTQVCRVFGVDFRREVVKELTAAGMSTRAIAPVVGVGDSTVQRDLHAGAPRGAPDPKPPVNTETGEVTGDYEFPAEDGATSDDAGTEPGEAVEPFPVPAPARPVTGLDGKTYTRPDTARPKRKPVTDQFFAAAYDMRKAIERVARIADDDRFTKNADQIALRHRNDLVRSRDLLEQVINSLPKNEVTR